MDDEFDAAEPDACALKIGARKFFLASVVDQNADNFSHGDLAHHLAVNPADSIQLTRPIAGIMRPGQPCRLMLFPFRGHGKSERSRGAIRRELALRHKSGGNIEGW